MTREDPELGLVRRCRGCLEWWPLTGEFYAVNNRTPGRRLLTCNACRAERRQLVRTPKADTMARRVRRSGPEGEALRARQRAASRRYYWKNAETVREREQARRAAKAAAEGRQLRIGFGRPRLAA